MVGITSGVVAQHVSGGISGWEEFGIVVIGALVAGAVTGAARRAWLWRHRPILALLGGNTKEFDRRMVKALTHYLEFAEGREILTAHAKFLRVEERNGNIARDVRAWITAVDPPALDEVSAVKLRWWNGEHTADIVPFGHDYLFLQQIIVTDDGVATTTPTSFQHKSPIEIEVTLYVGDKRHSRTRVELEHPWPGLPLDMAMQREEHDPVKIPDPFPYPRITKLVPRKSRRWSRAAV